MDLPSNPGSTSEAGTAGKISETASIGIEGVADSTLDPTLEEDGPPCDPAHRPGPDPIRGRKLPPADPWRRVRLVVPPVLITLSLAVALAWSNQLESGTSGPTLAGDDRPSVVAGEPSPSMLAAVRQVTPGSSEGDRVITVGPTQDGTTAPDTAVAASPTVPDGSAPSGSIPAETEIEVDGSEVGYGSGTTTGAAGQAAGPTTVDISEAPTVDTTGPPTVDITTGATAETAVPRPPDPPARVFPVNRADRLSTAALVDLVEASNITNVADFLSALPPFMGESYVLMEESRSRHQASTEYPRLIMYGPDARMLIGVSSHPLDPLREVVELAELDEATGLWRFSQLDFRNAFRHDTSTESCAGCHGSPQRPIWGAYPNWPGAFAGQDERLSGGQADSLLALKADPIDRFHTLAFPSDHSIANNGQLYLPTRQYGYANTSFNFELNAAVADGLARRIIGHPNWESDGHHLMAMQWRCDGRYDPASRDALYNRFGIDGNNDFRLESPVFEARADQRDEYDWNQGSTGLDRSVAFRTLDLAARQDRELAAIVESDRLFVDLSNAWFGVLGAERSAFLRSNGIYEIDFRPQNLGGGFVSQVCAHLEGKGA